MNNNRIVDTLIKGNLVILGVSFILMMFILLSAYGYIAEGDYMNPIVFQAIGYLIALVFGLYALRNKYFLVLVVIGYLIFFIGFLIERKDNISQNLAYCEELLRDSNCKLSEDGKSVSCKSGDHAGSYPLICKRR